MKFLRSLTVSQALTVVFASGFAVALLFAGSILISEFRQHRTIQNDNSLLKLTESTGALLHELQRERGLSSAVLAFDDAVLRRELTTQRLLADGQFKLLVNDHMTTETLVRIGADPQFFRDMRREVADLRQAVNAAGIDGETYRDRMTVLHKAMIIQIATAAEQAYSTRVAFLIRDAAALMSAKDSAGLERALGATMIGLAWSNPGAIQKAALDLTYQLARTRSYLDAYRTSSTLAARQETEAWMSSVPLNQFREFTELRLADVASGAWATWEPEVRQTWFTLADAYINNIRALEGNGQQRLAQAYQVASDGWWHFLRKEILILAVLTVSFGTLAWMTIQAVNSSIRRIISTICRLSVDATRVDIPSCPQADLNQISEALKVLRSVQITRHRQQQEAEALRARIDRKLDEVLTEAADGRADGRIEVLGLDAQSATLARGVNRLLDQLERRDKAASAH